MDPLILTAIAIVALVLVIAIGIPIGYALVLVGTGGLWIIGGSEVASYTLQRIPTSRVITFSLVVIPLFLLMGELATASGVAADAYSTLRTLSGRIRGSLAIATVIACGAFGAISGSSAATALTIGRPAHSEMTRHGYRPSFSLGTIGAGGTLGQLMPPSILLIIYAVIAEVSIARIFLAGIVPALLTIAAYSLLIVVRARVSPQMFPAGERTTMKAKARSIPGLFWGGLIGGIVLWGLYTGFVSLTETAALAAFAALLVWVIRTGLMKGDWGKLGEAVGAAVRLTAMIGIVLVGGHVFSTFVSFSGAASAVSEAIVGLDLGSIALLLVLTLAYVALGTFLETTAMMLLTIPFFLPAVVATGIDPLWFGIFFLKVAEVGLVTPPLGMNVYIVSSLDSSVPLGGLFKASSYYILGDVMVIILMIAVPDVALWLPRVAGG